MIQQDLFIRRYSVRLPQHLMTPVMPRLDLFEFPRNSIWHYAPMDNVLNGPASDEYFLRTIEKKIFVHHELELKDFKGNPRKVGTSLMPYVREYHIQNRRFRNCENIATDLPGELTLGIVNYALLTRSYRYVRSIYSEYYKWWNVNKTMWETISSVTSESDRLHFIFMNLPKVLPSVQRLHGSCNEVTQTTLKHLNTPEGFFLLEMWKWLSAEHRTAGAIGDMTQEQYDKINIVYQESGRWMVINLGKLNSWRFVKDSSPADQKVKITPEQLQKRFLRSMMVMMENRTVTDSEETSAIQEASDNPPVNEEQAEENQQEHADSILKNMDADLEQLAKFEEERDVDTDTEPQTKTAEKEVRVINGTHGNVSAAAFDRKIEAHDIVKAQCDKLADDGMLSGAEYRRYIGQIEKSQALEAPEGTGLLKDYVKIPKEDLRIDTPTTFADNPAVIDKSMLESSLSDFNKNYITKVLNKDIASMVVGAQKAGFIVTKYEKEVQEDILGSYEMHTVRVTPVEGIPSTLRFKIPKVASTGQYESGGIKYKIRMQRSDLPIRKISPSRVALSSYYGKLFVTRSEKRTNDYGVWLRDKITSNAIGEETTRKVLNLHPANVFDAQYDCPRIYSILAQSFRTFTIDGFEFYFNHKERDKVLGEDIMNAHKKSAFIPIGINPKGQLAALDRTGTLYFQDAKNTFLPAPSFEAIIGIDTTNSPVDFSQVKIFGKHIPVAFVLAYKYGFGKLLEMLGANYRKVNAGQRQNLLDNEYSLVFADETLIFSRDDVKATMILAGFNEYEKAIRNHSVYTFDNKGIYLVILEHYGLNGRYLKEIDLLDDMFVDAITEELLLEMKEPTSFRGLLVRSSELLLTDQHPHSLDMRQMRIKGYERIAGAVYSEIVNVAREHRSKPGRANAQMTLNPYAIWKAVTQDSACSIVEDINPIMNIKESEAVTYGGTGGRNSRAMVRTAREFHPSDMGVISESTTDSSDVAINTYTSANPRFNSVRGTANPIDMADIKPSNVLSTSAMLAVGAVNEDNQLSPLAVIPECISL